MSNALAKLDQARQALALAKTLDDILDLRDQAATVAYYLKKAGYSREAQNDAAELRLLAERKAGELLAETVNHDGSKGVGSTVEPTLPEGVNKKQSHRLQTVASVPEEAFREHVAAVKAADEELTTAGVLKLAAQHKTRAERNGHAAADQTPIVFAGKGYRVETADCLEFLAAQPESSVDLLFCSPPYEDARLYLEDGRDEGIALGTDAWVAWMVDVVKASLRVCKGLVAFVVEGRTENYRWSASPALLLADLHRAGINLRKPPVYRRVGIPGSGGPDWLRNDYEFIICATNGGPLPWSDNTAMGQPPKYEPGGEPSHREQDGRRVNEPDGYATTEDRANQGHHRARRRAGRVYHPPERCNPGNVVDCNVGGGNMGSKLCHENEAPFPESLAEFFVRSFCPVGGTVCDPFAGSGTTLAVALACGRQALGCDVRPSQVKLTKKRLANVTPPLFA